MNTVWSWWIENGGGVQQISSIVFASVGTVVSVVGLSTWKRQLRATAAREIIESATLVCDFIRIERLRPEPMVYFKDLTNFSLWRDKARGLIKKEQESWDLFSKELKQRSDQLKLCVSKNAHLMNTGLDDELHAFLQHVVTVEAAVKRRVSIITSSANSSLAQDYLPLVGLKQLLKSNPVLCGSNNQFEVDIRKAMDSFRSAVLKLY